jgi:branched-chain amino acid transport system substrate-binding protein
MDDTNTTRTRHSVARRRFIQAAGTGVVASFAGCSSSSDGGDGGGVTTSPGSSSGEKPPRNKFEGETIKIGVLGPLPEENPLGKSMANSATLAAKYIRDQEQEADSSFLEQYMQGSIDREALAENYHYKYEHMLGADVEVVVGNTEATPATAKQEYLRLTTEENVDLTVGVFFSSVINGLMDLIAQQEVPHFTTGAAAPQPARLVSQNYEQYKYHFRVGPFNSVALAKAQLEFIDLYADQLGWNKVGVLVEDIADLKPFHDYLKGRIGKHIDTPVIKVTSSGQTNWTPIYDDLESAGVDVALVGLALTGQSAAKQWADQQRPFEFGGIHVFSQFPGFWEDLSGKARYIFTMNSVTPQTENTQFTQPLMKAYNANFDSYPVYSGPITFDAVRLFAAAVRETGTLNPDRLVNFVESRRFEGVSTVVPFAEFTGPDAKYAHEPKFTCMSGQTCDNPIGVPLWQQWQKGKQGEGVEGAGVMECFAPGPVKTADYQKPHWI